MERPNIKNRCPLKKNTPKSWKTRSIGAIVAKPNTKAGEAGARPFQERLDRPNFRVQLPPKNKL
jgi:hypothetical protein